MSDNVQKYENWRAITESDYVTMFIKTWFAFVATLRELYPKENLDEVIGKGDKAFLNPYLNDFQNRYYHYNKLDTVKENILKVYRLGRYFTLENPKYHRFFAEDFYQLNKAFQWENTTDNYECSLKYTQKKFVVFYAKYYDKDFYFNGSPLIITEKIDISDLISSNNLSQSQVSNFIDDEAAFVNHVATEIAKRISSSFISSIAKENLETKFSESIYNKINAITVNINMDFETAIFLMKSPSVTKDNVLYHQTPCANFIYKVEDGATIPEVDTYTWFLNFVYFMRNALFHEIIDPLDAFWQEIFKHSYLALKEILDGNIIYFIEKEKVSLEIREQAWDELRNNPETYIPNYNDEINDNDIEIDITEYCVSPTAIELKSNIFLDYWFDEYSMKRMYATCDVELMRDDAKINKFKMKFIELQDLTVGV